jgi:hypothetical protein
MPSFRIPLPPPPQDGVFVLATPSHMLGKLSWEIGQLRHTLAEQSELLGAFQTAGYQAFNCAVTAWHCADWAWAYADDRIKQQLADKYNFTIKSRDRDNREQFFDAVCDRSQDIRTCRFIANSSKHLRLDKKVAVGFQTKIGSAIRDDKYIFGLLVEQDDGRMGMLEFVFDRAFEFWRHLYEELCYIEPRFIDGSSD